MISVVVPCLNEAGNIERCLRALLTQRHLTEPLEVIVADGGSTDGTRDILLRLAQSDARIRVVDNPKKIAAAGLNAAIQASRGNIILRMDAHTQCAQDYIVRCVDTLQQTGADNVGGPALTIANTMQQAAIGAAFSSRFSTGGASFHNPRFEGETTTVPYGCWRRELFDRVGLFDESLPRNEDDEHNLRIKRLGGRIWQSPKIQSWYFPRATLPELFAQQRQYGYFKVPVIQKHHAALRHLIPTLFLVTLATLVLAAIISPGARLALAALLGLYAAALAIPTIFTALRRGLSLAIRLPPILACYHFAYGLGFAEGIWTFAILKRPADPRHSELTRNRSR